MTIRQRLALAFLTIVLLFGLNVVIYFWGNARKNGSINELRRAVSARLLESSIERELEDRSKEVMLLGELGASDPRTVSTEQISELKGRLLALPGRLAELRESATPQSLPDIETVATSCEALVGSWNGVYDALLQRQQLLVAPPPLESDQALAAAPVRAAQAAPPVPDVELAMAVPIPQPLPNDRALEQIRELQDEEQARVELATAEFFRVSTLVDRFTVGMLVFSALVAVGVAFVFSRYLNQGLGELKEGAALIGAGQLGHRISRRSRDELGQLAQSFNTMSEGLQTTQMKLTEANRALEEQLNEAASYVTSLLPPPIRPTLSVATDWRFVPSSHLGGDAFGYHWLDDRRLSVYLVDVCGHGVGAALLSISVINVLRTQSLPDTDFADPAAVLRGLNHAFQMEEQNGMYFTIWYGVYDRSTRELSYANAGHPPPVLVGETPSGRLQTARLDRCGLAIGGFPDITYEKEVFQLSRLTRLYVFSDGIYEVPKAADGTIMTYDEFVEMLVEPAPPNRSKVDMVLKEVERITGTTTFADDVSLLELTFYV